MINDVNFLNNADLDGKAAAAARRAEHHDGGRRHAAEEGARRRRDLGVEVLHELERRLEDARSRARRRSPSRRITTCAAGSSRTACRSLAPTAASTRKATRSWRASSIAASAIASRSSPCTRSTRRPAVAACAGTSSASIAPARSHCTSKAPTHHRHRTRHRTRPAPSFRWMASPAIDKLGNIGIGYSFGGTTALRRTALRRAARRTIRSGILALREAVLVEGEAAQTTTLRWEDYTQTADRSVRRLHHLVCRRLLEEGRDRATRRRIGAFRFPGCTP